MFISSDMKTVVNGAMGCGQKIIKIVCRCHQLLSRFLANGHLPRVSCQSRLLANETGDNEMILGCYAEISSHLSYSWTKPRKISARKLSMKAVQPVAASNGVPYIKMTSIGWQSTSGREKEGVLLRYSTHVIITTGIDICRGILRMMLHFT